MSLSVVLLCLHLCVWWTLCCGQTCHSTGPERTCFTSDSCRAEHGNEEDAECIDLDQVVPTVLPDNVRKCSSLRYFSFAPCESHSSPANESYILDNLISAVNASFYSVNWKSFAINVSWEHRINPTEGYQLKFSRAEGPYPTFECLCIYDPNLRNLEVVLDLDSNIISDHFLVELSLINSQVSTSSTLITEQYEWPRSCLDIPHTDSTCALPTYGPPTDVIAYYEHDPLHNQTLYIEWSYQTEFTLPTVYYIEVYNRAAYDGNYYTFVTNNTNMVTISQLNDSVEFSITIRSYLHCSGLANKTFTLGCGNGLVVIPSPLPPTPSSSSTVPTPTIVPLPITSSPTPTPTSTPGGGLTTPHVVGISTAGGVCVISVVVVTIALAVVVVRCRRPKPGPKPEPPPEPNCSVFVAYITQTADERDIQTYIVCRLREYFDVITTSDKLRGDTIEWIEEQERTASAVLLVSTKEFHRQWGGEAESNIVLAMRRLITSAVSQECLDKYAVIVMDEESRADPVPDNNYLKSMRVYVLGKESNEVEELARYVLGIPLIEHRNQRFSSPLSSIASSDSNEYKSQCTVSVDMTLDGSLGFQDYFPNQRLDQCAAKKDAQATTQDSVGCVKCEQPNLPEQLFAILKPDHESYNITSLDSNPA